ncbi:MAG: leucine-rich repeat domain-containing protein [Prevotellaceae bacterium]|jgi:Leucine-rich repeat (LRR) protein|nr:leucine-rich repeat domain-containing protein [Prevotellaceae bacterium]
MNKRTIVLFTAVLAVGIGVPCCRESPEIVIADPVFETYCLTHFDKNGNGQIQKNEVKSIKSLNISGLGIYSLKGLEEFLSLECLDCSKNQLVRLYLSKNERLTTIYCTGNELPVLDVSHNVNLQTLECSHNKITKLNLSNCKTLKKLNCMNNPLMTIYVWPGFDAATYPHWDVPEYAVFQHH